MFFVRVRKKVSGFFWKSEEDGERGELGRDRSVSGSEEKGGFSWDHPLFKKYGLLLAKNKNKWALRWIGFCIGAVGCPCFVLEGLVLEAARDTL